MKFQRQMATLRGWPQGYSAPSTAFCVSDHGTWELGGGDDEVIEKTNDAPDVLKIQVEMVPKYFDVCEKTLVSYRTNNYNYHPRDLYGEPAAGSNKQLEEYGRMESICLRFKNFLDQGALPGGNDCELLSADNLLSTGGNNLAGEQVNGSGDIVLYQKDFVTQKGGVIEVQEDFVDGKFLFNPAPAGKQPFWGFGGFYKAGCSLADVQQVLITPFRGGAGNPLQLASDGIYICGVFFSKMQSLQQREGEVMLMGDFTGGQKHSLAFDIEKGAVEIAFVRGVDEMGERVLHKYKSFTFKTNDSASDLLEVSFRLVG